MRDLAHIQPLQHYQRARGSGLLPARRICAEALTEATLVQLQLLADPFSGQLFVFRGRRCDRIKVLWWDGDGMCLFAKRRERRHFV